MSSECAVRGEINILLLELTHRLKMKCKLSDDHELAVTRARSILEFCLTKRRECADMKFPSYTMQSRQFDVAHAELDLHIVLTDDLAIMEARLRTNHARIDIIRSKLKVLGYPRVYAGADVFLQSFPV
jgi:hypothetical protein